ncbi:hypothetical protein [Xiamenia xianingshaonis]|uniref:Uncharacterized protein n=1 Tax=Xiamenia xianingshaonis TaxID=2682776 RepID=A0ABX0IIR0_9ACTN|nr:hypothetical protein [Xiamenia xianingshaonis]NHM14620.1 hypothetical protein [Xiamenia xianingshaonis]
MMRKPVKCGQKSATTHFLHIAKPTYQPNTANKAQQQANPASAGESRLAAQVRRWQGQPCLFAGLVWQPLVIYTISRIV